LKTSGINEYDKYSTAVPLIVLKVLIGFAQQFSLSMNPHKYQCKSCNNSISPACGTTNLSGVLGLYILFVSNVCIELSD